LESGSRPKSPLVQKKVSPTTQKRQDEQNAAIQSKGKDLDMERGAEVDVEMAEAEVTSRTPVTIVQPDKGKGRENPAIILEPLTPVKGLTDLPDVGSSKLKGKHQKQLCFSSLTVL